MSLLFLCPATTENMNKTMLNAVPFSRADILQAADIAALRSLYPTNAPGFHCWALRSDKTQRGDAFAEVMSIGDVCLFSVRASGTFGYAARVLGKIRSQSFGTTLWGDAPGEHPWEFLFYTTPPIQVTVPKQEFLTRLGYRALNYMRPVQNAYQNNLMARIGTVDRLWNDISQNNDLGYLYR
jgi:hypothetical protein